MASSAATTYRDLAERASIILKADRSNLSRTEIQSLYGAAFVAQVAAWNAYVKGLVDCFFQKVADSADAKYHAMHTLANSAVQPYMKRFNTPNAQNTRDLFMTCIGYDPWADWQWPARGMSALAVRSRLDEILQVRHSLTHGFAMPGWSWNESRLGQPRLTMGILAWTRAFFHHLVAATDQGLASHMGSVHGVTSSW